MIPAKGASLVGLRGLNARAVLSVIRARAPISRAQVSREVGLTRPTVAAAMETLLRAGLVREAPPIDNQPSFGATFFEPAPDAAYFAAFDIDRRQCRAVLVDAWGQVAASGDAAGTNRTPEDLVAHAAGVTRELCQQAEVAEDRVVLAIAGVPAAVDPRDGMVRLSAYRLIEGFPLGQALSEAMSVPAVVHNDTNLAAVGERAEGVAWGVSDFAYITVGRSVGAGIVLRGEVMAGYHGASGEIDTPITDTGFLPGSPAADAFAVFAREIMAAHGTGAKPKFSPTPASVFAAARRGNEVAKAIVTEEAKRIAERAALVCRVVDIELVVLGGGIGRHCDLILDQIRASLATQVRYPPRVEVSPLTQPPVLVGARAVGVDLALDAVTSAKLG
ncbi:MAG TPA: ROK family transcriptional regulator [Streptosporangiaceae bacterium]|nr:ROK family transcriptional regulator [Streptosporangiaceae bacterium]